MMIVLFLFAIVSVGVAYLKIYRPLQYWKEKNVKYLHPWPILGILGPSVLLSKPFILVLQDAYRKFRHHRYFGIYIFSTPILVIKDPELVKVICIKEFNKFTDRPSIVPEISDPLWSKGILTRKGNEWRDLRAVVSPAFSNFNLKAMFGLIAECANSLLSYLERNRSEVIAVEMRDMFGKVTNDVIASCIFGIECDSLRNPENEFFAMAQRRLHFNGRRGIIPFTGSINPILARVLDIKAFGNTAYEFFSRIVKENIREREKNGLVRPDVIHLLKEAKKDRLNNTEELTNDKHKISITDEDIISQTIVLFFASYETVTSLLCHMCYELAINPDIQKQLIKEIDCTFKRCSGAITYELLMKMKYANMVVHETLRLWSSITVLSRTATDDVVIDPISHDEKPLRLPKGAECLVPVHAIHRDAKHFPDPDKFDPERFRDERNLPASFLGFGAGPRHCLGDRLTLLQVKVLMFRLLTHFEIVPVKETAIPFPINPVGFFLHSKDGYHLGLKRRMN